MKKPYKLVITRQDFIKGAKSFFKIDVQDVIIAFLAVMAFIIFIPIFTYFYFAKDLQSKDNIMNRKDTGLILLDDKNRPFFTFYSATYKDTVPLSEISDYARDAVIASEDKDFYKHPGFSISSIFRSAAEDIDAKQLAYGGSTITQQLVKNSLLTSNKNFLRKYQEIVLAAELERRYSKDQILEMYLNSVYFGEGAFGIQEAAQVYFGKDAKDLDPAESALLAGLLPAPSQYSPLSNDPAQSKVNEQIILQKMQEQGYITEQQKLQGESEQLAFKPGNTIINNQAPAFALMVRDDLIQKYGEETVSRSGFRVHTTIDLDMQSYAQQVVTKQVANLKGDDVSNGAAVVMDPSNGEVKALIGSKDWNDPKFGKVNMVTSPRQPGSSFKPIVYSAAMEEHLITPATILQDVPTTFNQCPGVPSPIPPSCLYKPKNYDNQFWGPITARRALANSRNVPAVEVMQKVGLENALDMAHRLGITTLTDPSNYGLSLVLGAGEVKLLDMATVYGTFANQGQKVEPTLITSIDDKYGDQVYQYQPSPEQVISPEVAFLISSILSDNNARAEEFGNTLTINRTAAVKTGTTEDFRDAWTMGYTPSLVVGAWVGNNDNAQMDQVAGSLGAAPIWRQLMEKFSSGPDQRFTPPPGVVPVTVCGYNGLKVRSREATSSAYTEYFLDGTEPTGFCDVSAPAPSGSPQPGQTPSPTPSQQPGGTPTPTPTQTPSDQGGSTTTTTNCVNGVCTTTVT